MRGELFWAETVNQDGSTKRRPVLEMSAIELTSPLVVPMTTIERDIPSDVPIKIGNVEGVLNTLAIGPIERKNLVQVIGFVQPDTLIKVCNALSWTTGC